MARRVLIAFVDALGSEQLERFGGALSFVPHRRALTGVLGYSSGALATVLTGAHASEHGRMCLFAQRREGDDGLLKPLKWLGLLPRVLHERGAFRRKVAQALASARGLTGYVALHRVPPKDFEWLDLPEREDLFAAKDIGGVPTFLSQAREAGLSVYASPWQLPEAERWRHVHETLARSQPELTFLYAAEMDGVLHAEGNDGQAAQAVRGRIAGELDRAREALLRGGHEVLTIVVGDHGMAEVSRTIDPRELTSKLDARVFVDSTMLRFWGTHAQLGRARLLAERAKLPGRWLDTSALRERNAAIEGAPYGSALFVLDEGVIFAPSFVGGRARGMHGYDLDARSARAAIASDAPLPEDLRALTDLAPLVSRALGLAARGAAA
ncbi:MAG: alkaline phosphatase family protein [Deltaproteobacteria bacterium]|nr:alkaline phosphatase family protein [Deltaproteobacteria bacterium]